MLCVHCNRVEAVTVDHVPPACLFPSPRPNNLVTVPSCEGCNRGASKDDEYFRMTLVMRRDVPDNPDTQRLLDAVHRSFAKPQKRGMVQALLQNVRQVHLRSPAGLYLGLDWAYDVDLERLGRVTNRIVKGLYYREFGQALPPECGVRSFAGSGLRGINNDMRARVQQTVQALLQKPRKTISSAIFEYWYDATHEDPFISAWLFRFFQRESFLCLTAPEPDTHKAAP